MAEFQAGIAGMVSLAVTIMFALNTPVLASFGVPRRLSDVTDPQQLLHLLQMYNRELIVVSEGLFGVVLVGALVLVAAGRVAVEAARLEGPSAVSNDAPEAQGRLAAGRS